MTLDSQKEPFNRRATKPCAKAEVGGKPKRIGLHYKFLILIFLISLPSLNPWVRGDGVGYYAYVRAPLIEHNLDFEYDWLHANSSFRLGHVDNDGHVKAEDYTATHHLNNHFSVGPAMLWAPFLLVVHGVILALNYLGGHFQADGYARPYVLTMAIATAIYGFGAVCLSFSLTRKYVEERWAFISVVSIWFGSSLPVYMYLNPSWSHAHSAFATALFLWYWNRTRKRRSLIQWAVLGLISGLMINVYFPNAILLIVVGIEGLLSYRQSLRQREQGVAEIFQIVRGHLLYVATVGIALLPTIVSRHIIYGSAFYSGYTERWFWTDPRVSGVLFSSHGLFSWTPILILAVSGLVLTWKRDRVLTISFVTVFLAFLYLIASYENWFGISSFGNRFFVSLTPLFVLGLAMILSLISGLFVSRRSSMVTATLLVLPFVLWNLGLMLQWGLHLVPVRGPVSWRTVVHNQFTVVPEKLVSVSRIYVFRRSELMQKIEKRDLEELQKESE